MATLDSVKMRANLNKLEFARGKLLLVWTSENWNEDDIISKFENEMKKRGSLRQTYKKMFDNSIDLLKLGGSAMLFSGVLKNEDFLIRLKPQPKPESSIVNVCCSFGKEHLQFLYPIKTKYVLLAGNNEGLQMWCLQDSEAKLSELLLDAKARTFSLEGCRQDIIYLAITNELSWIDDSIREHFQGCKVIKSTFHDGGNGQMWEDIAKEPSLAHLTIVKELNILDELFRKSTKSYLAILGVEESFDVVKNSSVRTLVVHEKANAYVYETDHDDFIVLPALAEAPADAQRRHKIIDWLLLEHNLGCEVLVITSKTTQGSVLLENHGGVGAVLKS